jgi:hypothetical protein
MTDPNNDLALSALGDELSLHGEDCDCRECAMYRFILSCEGE